MHCRECGASSWAGATPAIPDVKVERLVNGSSGCDQWLALPGGEYHLYLCLTNSHNPAALPAPSYPAVADQEPAAASRIRGQPAQQFTAAAPASVSHRD